MLGKKGQNIPQLVYCLRCKSYSIHRIASSTIIDEKLIEDVLTQKTQNLEPPFTITIQHDEIKYKSITQLHSQIIYCEKCKNTSLRNIRIDKNNDEPDYVEIIPPRPEYEKKLDEILPLDILSLYKEALFVFLHSFNFSCGASLRSLIELICKNRGHKKTVFDKIVPKYIKEAVKNGRTLDDTTMTEDDIRKCEIRANLSQQVQELKREIREKRPNSKLDFNIIDSVIEWGNENIHSYKVPVKEELDDVINIINFLFHALYIDEHEENKYVRSEANFKSRR